MKSRHIIYKWVAVGVHYVIVPNSGEVAFDSLVLKVFLTEEAYELA